MRSLDLKNSNRKQFVDFDGDTLSNLGVNCRVPRGSVLGPLLFLLYIEDLANLQNHVCLALYVGDTKIACELKNLYVE